MKSFVFFLLLTSAGIVPFAFKSQSWSQETGLSNYALCYQIKNHKSLYNHGKLLAIGWMHWTKVSKKDETRHPVKTRNSFITRATLGLNKKNGITESKNSDLYSCNLGYMGATMESRWSSLHDGLVDYLPAAYKVKFMALPER